MLHLHAIRPGILSNDEAVITGTRLTLHQGSERLACTAVNAYRPYLPRAWSPQRQWQQCWLRVGDPYSRAIGPAPRLRRSLSKRKSCAVLCLLRCWEPQVDICNAVNAVCEVRLWLLYQETVVAILLSHNINCSATLAWEHARLRCECLFGDYAVVIVGSISGGVPLYGTSPYTISSVTPAAVLSVALKILFISATLGAMYFC